MLTVGYWDQNYPEKRNIIYSGEHTEAVTYIPIRRDYSGAYYRDIAPKAKVLHPPQKINITSRELQEKFSSIGERLELMLVGSAFWWKGGKEVVESLEQFSGEYPIHLTIVSNFNTFRAEEFGYTKEDFESCMRLIDRNRHWITVYNTLSNRQVLKLMKKSHIGLLPSYGDTYGFSVLEFQASGCPVITTDHRAFPEINPSDCGWMTQIEGKHNGIRERREDNKKQMSCIIEDILEHPEQIVKKAQNSVERIREQHDPAGHAERLLAEYRKALKVSRE